MSTIFAGPKRKYPRALAEQVVADLLPKLMPFCHRMEVAGSYRRGKAEVGDVELVFMPKLRPVKMDLFGGTTEVDTMADRLDALVREGVLSKRLNVRGAVSWGPKNKLAQHCASGMPVDLFATSEDAWWNYLVCRTGSAENNVRISQAAQDKGWRWEPYGAGFMTPEGLVRVESEEALWGILGLPYVPPEQR